MKRTRWLFLIISIFISCSKQSDNIKEIQTPAIENVKQNSSSTYIAPTKKEHVFIEANYDKRQNEIWAESDGSKRLLGYIPYKEYETWFVQTGENIYFTKKKDPKINPRDIKKEIMSFPIFNGIIISTGLFTSEDFAVSTDSKYICVAMDDHWEDDSWSALHYSIPYLYDLKDRKLVHIYDFTKDFLMDQYGISLYIEYDKSKNSMKIEYHWDTPVPSFEGFISLEDFQFTRMK